MFKNLKSIAFATAVLGLTGCGSSANPSRPGVARVAAPSTRTPAELTATQVYGPLKVQSGEFDAQAAVTPWSSWWYPLNEKRLFEGTGGNLSPLEKYDAYARATGKNTHASDFERQNLYDPEASGWEGLCNAWAAASILEAEPTQSITAQGITFKPSDQKALLLKAYEHVEGLTQFGLRFDGNRGDDPDDIYPDQFHKILQEELFLKGHAFIMDKDPGVPVWNEPVYKAFATISADKTDATTDHVSLWLTWADSASTDPDFQGTRDVNSKYTYDLVGDRQADGSLNVVYGVWTGESVDNHPDFVTVLPAKATHRSINTEVDTTLVNQILGR